MEIEKLTPEKYAEWDDFCLKSDDAWFWHTAEWLKYTLGYRPDLQTESHNFFVRQGGEVKAIVPLTLETYKQNGSLVREFSFGGSAIPAPALANDLDKVKHDRVERESVTEAIFAEIDRLARELGVKRISLKDAPLSKRFLTAGMPFNHLMKSGYLDLSLNTRLVDLAKSEEELWDDLRRNHKRNVKKGAQFKTVTYTKDNATRDIFLAYKNMHHKAAGRQTRPDETFELMYEWLTQGLAFLTVVEFNGAAIGFEYYSIYKNNVYGFSAANDPDYERDYPIRHLLEWEAIRFMKSQGYDHYELGLQQFDATLFDWPDKKQLDITHFKKGFGGFVVPFFRGEKFYDEDYFKTVMEERLNKYQEAKFIHE